MKCVIHVPYTEDWASFTLEGYLAHLPSRFFHHNRTAEARVKLERFIRQVRLWSDYYNIPYTAYRQKLKDITEKNWSRLECKRVICDTSALTKDDIVLVCDDDDWLNPAVIPVVEKIFSERADIDVVHWDAWQYRTSWFFEECVIFKDVLFGSNSFAVRGGLNQQYYSAGAHNYLEWGMDKSRVLFLPNVSYSVWNIHLGTFSVLSEFPLHDHIFTVHRRPRPAILDWAAEEIESMYSVVTSMTKSC
jgi:hypothetical protein